MSRFQDSIDGMLKRRAGAWPVTRGKSGVPAELGIGTGAEPQSTWAPPLNDDLVVSLVSPTHRCPGITGWRVTRP